MSILELTNNLKKSPLFNLSLSSKELFHSNFIAWICENYPEKFGKILLNYFNQNSSISSKKIISVKRENRNLDLTLEFENKNLIIENKVKSIPNEQQLIDYKNKSNPNDLFILLTIIKPAFDIKKIGWEIITYDELSNLLELLKKKIKDDNIYHFKILEDYIFFIRQLSLLIKNIDINIEVDSYNFYSEEFHLFKDIRLHDLYLKYKYNDLIDHIYNFLKIKLENDVIIKGKRYSHEKNKNEIVLSFNLVNGKGVVNIDYSNENEIIYGIILDGNRYNLYLYSWGEKLKRNKEIANELRADNKWFTFDFITEDQSYPKKGKDYNKFGDLIYRSAKINSETELKELLNRIYLDVIRVKKINTNANKV